MVHEEISHLFSPEHQHCGLDRAKTLEWDLMQYDGQPDKAVHDHHYNEDNHNYSR